MVKPPQLPRAAIAWPTIFFFAASIGAVLIPIYFFLTRPELVYSPLAVVGCLLWSGFMTVLIFSPAHEASHRNIARSRIVNDWIGRIAIFWMHGSFQQFKEVHLDHHAHANVPLDDPDFHAARKPNCWSFFLWSFSLAQYLGYLLRKKKYFKKPLANLTYLAIASLYFWAYQEGVLVPLIVSWTLPALAGTALVVYIFDHLPHTPHKESSRYRLARIVEGSPFLFFIMQGHNYHLIHHLWPSIPWYQYRKAFELKKSELLEAGAPVSSKF